MKLHLGTVQFGLDYGISNSTGKPDRSSVFKILDKAYTSGIRFLDTAAAYGNSEELIGEYLASNPAAEFKIISKFKMHGDLSPKDSFMRSLDRLGLQKIDTLLYHSFADYIDFPAQRQILKRLAADGKIHNIGVSVYSNEEIDSLLDDYLITTIQVPFNLLDNERKRGDTLRKAKENGKQIITRSVFLQGLFFMEFDKLPDDLKPLQVHLNTLKEVKNSSGFSLAELALSYALKKDYIDGVLIGVDTPQQLMDNIQAIGLMLPESIEELIDDISVSNIELLNPSNWKK